MDDPKQNVYASATPDTESKPIQGRPVGRAPRPESTQPPAQDELVAPSETLAAKGDHTTLGTVTMDPPYPPETNGVSHNGDANGASEISANGETSETWAPHGTATVTVVEPEVEQPAAETTTEEATEKPDTRPAWRRALSTIIGTRWVLVIPAVILAIYAEQLTEEARTGTFRLAAPPLLSWQLFVLAGLLLALATFPGKSLLPSGRSAFWRGLAGMKQASRLLFFGCLGGAIICTAAALPLFWQLDKVASDDQASVVAQNFVTNTGSWILYIASLLLFGLAFVIWERNVAPPEDGTDANPPLDRLPRLVEWGIMLGVFVLALVLRMNNLQNVPPGLWFDEAQNGVVGRNLLAPGAFHYTFIQDFTQMGALYFYFDGLMVKFFGNNIWVVRFLPALAGSLIAPMLYLLGSRLYGWRVGLAAAGFVAVSSWNITFSRFGMASMPTVALDVAVFLCAAQALRTGRLGYYAGAGVLMGLSLQIYYPSRLVPIILGAILLHRLITQHIKLIRSIRAGIVVFAVGAILAFMPVGLFAIEQPAAFNGRTDTVSIFSPQNNGGNLQLALNQNIQKHMLMFNWLGDGNGRHNLPGSPMLDWIMAALFFAGLASCVLRFWRWQYFFPIVWFIAALSGGVLSIPFEAPQSHRAIEASVVTPLLAGIFIGEVWALLAGAEMVKRISNGFSWLRSRTRRNTVRRAPSLAWPMRVAWALSAVTLLVVLWLAGSLDYQKYFNVQAQDMSVWKDMYAPQAHAAEISIRYGPDHDVYMAPILKGLPPSVYLAPNVQTLDWPGMQALPLSTNKPGGVVIILDLPSAADVAAIARMYPHAQFELYTAPTSPEVLIYTITVPAEDINAVRGVRATSLGGGSDTATNEVVPDFSNDTANLKMGGNGTVRLAATLRVDNFGKYNFDWRPTNAAPGAGTPGQLMVDGYTVAADTTLTMGTGLHSIVVTDTVKGASDASQLYWHAPGAPEQPVPMSNLFDPQKVEVHGLTGTYYPGLGGDTPSQTGHIDPTISFNFHQTPLPRPYTAVWEGKLYIPQDGTYVLGTEQLSTSRLFFDGQEIITNNSINNMMEHPVTVNAGLHDIRLVYTDRENYSHVYLYWTPPGRPHSIIPSAFLWPTMGSYPDKPESGVWPTLDESDGSQLPPSRVTFYPPRSQQPQQSQVQQAPPVGDQQVVQPQQPLPQGKQIKPLFVLGEDGVTLLKPRTVAADAAGNIYVFSETNSQVSKFGPDGKLITSWAVKDSAGKPMTEISAIVVKDDKVMLLDAASSTLLQFSLDGKDAGHVTLCQCFFPRGASVAKDGNLWVANTGGSQVLKITPDGQQLDALGDKGTEPGNFTEPAAVAEAPDGTLYVADIGNKRVQSFTPDHKPLAQWDMGQSVARDGNRLTVDSKGDVLVTEYDSRNVVLYDKQGKELDRWFYAIGGNSYVPQAIAPLGDDKFVVLYPDANVGVVFSIK